MVKMLRFAAEQDAEALLEIYRPYVETTSITFETQVPTVAEFTERIRDILTMFPYLVIEEGGELLGYAYAHPFHQRAAYDWTVESSIYVRQDARHEHLGMLLYEALLERLACQGVRNVCAVVTVPNEPSTAFHKRMGFRSAGILPDFGYKMGQWHGVEYLYLRLGAEKEAPKPLIPQKALPEELRTPVTLDKR